MEKSEVNNALDNTDDSTKKSDDNTKTDDVTNDNNDMSISDENDSHLHRMNNNFILPLVGFVVVVLSLICNLHFSK